MSCFFCVLGSRRAWLQEDRTIFHFSILINSHFSFFRLNSSKTQGLTYFAPAALRSLLFGPIVGLDVQLQFEVESAYEKWANGK